VLVGRDVVIDSERRPCSVRAIRSQRALTVLALGEIPRLRRRTHAGPSVVMPPVFAGRRAVGPPGYTSGRLGGRLVTQMLVEESQQLASEIEIGRRHAMQARPEEQAAAEILGGEDHLRGRLVAPVAEEVRRDAGLAQRLEIRVRADLLPEAVAR